MVSAIDFLPSRRILLTSWVTSGAVVHRVDDQRALRGGALARHYFFSFLAPYGSGPACGCGRPGRPANRGRSCSGPREVLHPAATHEHDGVLLQVVADAGDVGGDLDARGQLDARDLAQRRVRLLGRGRVDARADTASLGRALEGRGLGLADLVLAALADQLVDRGQPVLRTSSRVDLSRRPLPVRGSLVVSTPGDPRPPRSGVSVAVGRGALPCTVSHLRHGTDLTVRP